MTEERGATTEMLADRLEARFDQFAQNVGETKDEVHRLAESHHVLREDVAELKGEVRQMDRRLTNIEQSQRQLATSYEQGQRWLIGLILGVWVTLMLAILGPYLKG